MTDKLRGGGWRQTPPNIGFQCMSSPKQKYTSENQLQFMQNLCAWTKQLMADKLRGGEVQTDTPKY